VFADIALGERRRRAIVAGARAAVAEIVLHRRRHTPGRLHAGDSRGAECRGKIRILAECFVESRPERLASNIEDWREVPWEAGRERLARGDLAHLADEIRVEGRRHADVVREDRATARVVRAVHEIDAVQDRHAETRLFRGDVLDLADQCVPAIER
jgi:hypothetical protein